jgi:hypothetical protein
MLVPIVVGQALAMTCWFLHREHFATLEMF